MLILKVRSEQILYVENLLKKTSFGQRGDGSRRYNNGNKEEQFVGMLGEVVTTDLFRCKRPECGDKGDGGVDLTIHGQRIDVKTMGRNCNVKNHFIHNLHGDQVGDYYKNDIYLFTSLNKRFMELTICGWVTKEEFFERALFYPYGTVRRNPSKTFRVRSKKGLYEIKNYKLNPFKNRRQFCKEMELLRECSSKQSIKVG